ncbi:MAG: hypothetical protein JXA01_05715 [Dehalococcoidia bacterium]|nr:hypothetical protein [Dehalococcoidia bacterium]
MKKEQLLRKLDNVDLPELLVVTHKESLKKALMEGTLARQYACRETAPGIGAWLEGFLAWLRGPLWRTALASSLTLLLIGAVLGVSVYLASPSPAVLAADIVKKDPGIQQKLSGTGDIIIVRVEVREKVATVVCGRSLGDLIEADVDIPGRVIVSTKRFEGLFLPEVPLEAQDSAVRIASGEPSVKAMLDKGATIGRIFPVFTSINNIAIINGNILKVTPATTQAVVPVIMNDKVWMVQVNLEQQKIEKIIEPQTGLHYDNDTYFMLINI